MDVLDGLKNFHVTNVTNKKGESGSSINRQPLESEIYISIRESLSWRRYEKLKDKSVDKTIVR